MPDGWIVCFLTALESVRSRSIQRLETCHDLNHELNRKGYKMTAKKESKRKSATSQINRREVLGWGAAAGGLTLAGLPFSGSAQTNKIESEMVFACNGGNTQKNFKKFLIPPFSKKHGTKITYLAGQPANNVAKVRAQKNSPSVDALWLAGAVTYQAIGEKLVAVLDPARLPSLKDIPANVATQKRAAPVGVSAVGLLYRKDVYEQKGMPAPTSWFDLWNPKLKGHVGCYSINVTACTALIAMISELVSGGHKNLDKAFAKFAELGRQQDALFYTSGGASEKAMQQGDIWLAMNTTTRARQMIAAGVPIGFVQPKEGVTTYPVWVGVVEGAPHSNAAYAWAEYLISTEGQSKIAKNIGYIPVNPTAAIPAGQELFFPNIKDLFVPDWEDLTAQLPQIVKRWNREVERS